MPNTDEDFGSAETVHDEALGELAPEEFDLDAWIAGIGPARAEYTIDGVTFTLEARTKDWMVRTVNEQKGADELTLGFALVAGHIVSPTVTADQLKALYQVMPREVDEMGDLATTLDTKTRRMIPAHFLPAASA